MDVDMSKNFRLEVKDEKKLTKALAASIFELNNGSFSICAAFIDDFLFGFMNGLIFSYLDL